MNEEEKKAVRDSKNIINELNNHKDKDFIGRMYYKNKPIEEILEILLNLIEKMQKENEELKEKKKNIEPVLIGNKMYFIDESLYEDLLNDIKNNYIPVQKVKDKIELLEKKTKYEQSAQVLVQLYKQIKVLKGLLEESEK